MQSNGPGASILPRRLLLALSPSSPNGHSLTLPSIPLRSTAATDRVDNLIPAVLSPTASSSPSSAPTEEVQNNVQSRSPPTRNGYPIEGRSSRQSKLQPTSAIVHGIKYKAEDFWSLVSSRRKLCSECREIPFAACLPRGSATHVDTSNSADSPASSLHIIELKHILKMSDSCPCCGLLLQCVRKPENDLFRTDHIKKPLRDSQRLRNIATFDKWVDTYGYIKREIQGEEAWPFGYTADAREATQAMKEAEALFESAEERDLHAGRLDELISSVDGLANALDAATFGMNMVGAVKPDIAGKTGHMLGSTRAVMHLMAVLVRAQRKALPCIFVIRPYRPHEEKGGVVSVRVFAYGRGARASLKEICHFSLRSVEAPRRWGRQLWYGQPLQPTVDVKFFKTCLSTCQDLHHDVCGSISGAHSQMCIVETDFEESISLKQYVTLSYTWGADRNDHVKLTTDTLHELTKPGALASKSLPETIKDAISVVRQMNVTYLWVDRLCIPQRGEHEEEHPDNPANIANMGRIYGEALFTIVAGSAQGVDRGLWGMKPGREMPSQVICETGPDINLFLPSEMPQDLRSWESRAWTFQEKLLSRRMLVFSGGFAVWRCRCAIWREDVNALDGDITALSFPWLNLREVEHAAGTSPAEQFGLRMMKHDESTRLFRGLAFHQYVQCVEDFSCRDIADAQMILDACAGILKVLGSSKLLNSSFLHGLPKRFIDAALLWQPKGKISRRTGRAKKDRSVNTLPSWSWAGWEAWQDTSRSRQVVGESKGAGVSFAVPFDLRVDDVGLLFNLSALGEERIRPVARIFSVSSQRKLSKVGLLGEPWMQAKESPAGTENATFPKDWEHGVTAVMQEIPFENLGDRHLVLRTQLASLCLGRDCFRVRRKTKVGGKTYCRETLENTNPITSVHVSENENSDEEVAVVHERWIVDADSHEKVGTASVSYGTTVVGGAGTTVKALVLSEAQFLGLETKPDVLGYPVYNVCLVDLQPGGFAERVGLGKIYKAAWKRRHPEQRTIFLG